MKRKVKFNPADIYLKEKKMVDAKLSGLLKNKKPESLYEPCNYILASEGKRIRALLVLFSARTAGSSFRKFYNAAVAVEILHNFTLVHDDIMDNADKRRGKPTLHVKYDLSTAILSGDNLIAIAYQQLLKDCQPQHQSVIETFTNGIMEVCEGQSLDKEFEIRNDVSLDEYLVMITKKTAALAEMCCSIGGQLGGADARTLRNLKNYGRNLGIAFQIQDDILDIVANESHFGKPTGSDLIEGKKTFLFLSALKIATGSDKKLLKEMLKNGGIKRKDVVKYKEIYERLGVLLTAQSVVENYTHQALNCVKKLNDEKSRILLYWLANSLLNRNK